MKKVILLLIIILIQQFASAQKYEKHWNKVENYELQERPKSALGIVDKIYKKATRKGETTEIIKCFFYHSKFINHLKEDSQDEIIRDISQLIQNSKFPTTAILESMYAEMLDQYAAKNRYKIGRRTQTDSTNNSDDYKTWDLQTLTSEIEKHYRKSLAEEEKLKQLSLTEFELILTKSDMSQKYRPTLFDFLSHRAIDFYSSEKYYLNRPKLSFIINNPVALGATKEFAKETFDTSDSIFSNRNTLILYQKLENFHLKQSDTLAYVDVLLERLNFVQQNSVIENKKLLYNNRLKMLAEEFGNHEAAGIINYQIANNLYNTTTNYNSSKNNSNRIDALKICKKVIQDFPKSEGAYYCSFLKSKIENPVFNFKLEKNNLPNQSILSQVAFKNLKQINISIFKVGINDILYDQSLYYRSYLGMDSIVTKVIKNSKPVKITRYHLPNKNDYYEYTTELDLPQLDIGNYIVVASTEDILDEFKDVLGYGSISITNMALLTRNNNDNLLAKVINRSSGEPIPNIKFLVKKDSTIYKIGLTDSNGEFKLKKALKENLNLKSYIFSSKDTLVDNFSLYRLYNNRSDDDIDEEWTVKPYLYLDRSIYRPGQTVYFKGILTQKKNGISSIVPNVYVTVTAYDTNYNEIKEFRLKTNEYGSVSGEFKLPSPILTGEFTIEMDEDINPDGDDDPFWEDVDYFDYIEQSFSVEEYKRPRFEVIMHPITESFKLGDSIQLKGKAEAFLGSSINNAQVNYTVKRETEYNWLHRNYNYQNQVIKNGSTTTNNSGNFNVDFIATPDSTFTISEKPIFKYVINVDVIDINGETRNTQTQMRLGYHNITLDLSFNENMKVTSKESIKVESKNLNGEVIPSKGTLKIFKLQHPERFLKTRTWELPDIQTLTKEEFISKFPYISYDSTELKENWKKGKMVFEAPLNTEGTSEINLNNLPDWNFGYYVVTSTAVNKQGDSITLEKRFTLKDKEGKLPFASDLINYEIVNHDYAKDGYVQLLFRAALDSTYLNLSTFHKEEAIYEKTVILNKGNNIINIPINHHINDNINIKYYVVKDNRFLSNAFNIFWPTSENLLNIEVLTFRNRLTPDRPETWSFKITGTDKNYDAELLASMYDASLDEFKKHNWNTNINFNENNYYYIPGISQGNYFSNESFRTFLNNSYNHRIAPYKTYRSLNWFGFDFNGSVYLNRRYLSNLAKEKTLRNSEKNSVGAKVKGGAIKGVVTDSNGDPLPGVNVLIKGTSKGTTTDFDGYFTIETEKNDVLVFSFVGMVSTEAIVTGNNVNVSMTEDAQNLEEVVITALGIQREMNLTGSVMSYQVVQDKLQGQVAGVEVQQLNGSENTFRIRGNSSIQNGNKLLYVIDGVLQNEIDLTMNPSDIVDITVIKGRDATALYGSKGVNGVIVITTKKGLEASLAVEPRDNLKETAFFLPHLTTDKNGVVSFNFNSPQALTKWKLMLLAHNKELAVGTLEKTAITQKDLMVIPNPPRFLREGDTITLSAKITNLTNQTLSGISVLQLFDAVNSKPVDVAFENTSPNKTFNTTSKGSTNVSWKLAIPEGIQALQYKIIAKSGNFSDGEENILPVLTNRALVTESKPIWVKPKSKQTVVMEGLKENQSSTLQNHLYSLEYTSNPAWYAIKSLPYLIQYPYDCAEQTFSKFYANSIASHILNSNPKINGVFDSWKKSKTVNSPLETNEELKSILIAETPWLKDVQSESEQKKRLGELFDIAKLAEQELFTLNRLDDLQLKSGAFPWFSGGKANNYITRHIVAGFGHLKQLHVEPEYQYRINALVEKAIKYLDKDLVNNFKKLKKYNKEESKIHLYSGIAHYLYLRSFYLTEHPFNYETKKIVDFYIEKSKKDWKSQNLYTKGMIALYMHRMKFNQVADNIMTSLQESAVQSDENGMYWKENKASWYWYQSPIETQALLIEAFSEIKSDSKIVDELKLWLLKNKRTNSWDSTKATTEATYALLMQGSDWLSVSDNTIITVGSEKIKTKKMDMVKKEAGSGYFKLNWKVDEITSDMAEVTIANKSDMTGYGGVYWEYFEDLDKIKTTEGTPLSIKKELYLNTNTDSGKQLVHINNSTNLNVGDLITVRIEITSEFDMEYIHLKDMRAASLEPIDVLSEYKWQDGLGYFQSTKDTATHFFFDNLPKGTYIFEYNLRVNNSGDFSNGISTLQSMYAPEFSGHTKGIRLKIQ
ncbi:TonB-dependent outer membrane receptor, SusC/RagA subfamily, signature region [Zhouia amylolytica]|uniref:TonB-dependent outer membrane receptor, SusC/RagA subfamily, signature region n=1 Tax=Zhouia amylolytica TaxID=376730 RepID=A0A1I6TY18_9FLAO|nr:carboxypeptidase-like regulatory domain-containing protein [Zhouia amylolytica]SFS93998.1 TonB-dependent outer membrane receptor, SusC/RagA subfamily, signature region [Zhouia amylolytica]